MVKAKLVAIAIACALLLSAVASAENAVKEETKKVEVSASVDIGDNAKDILANGGDRVIKIIEQLAQSLQMSAKELFPYYVKQAVLNGYMPMIVWCAFEISCLIITGIGILAMFFFIKKKPFADVDHNETAGAICGVITIIVCVVFLIGLLVGAFNFPNWVTLIKNPEYEAIHNIIKDASELIKK